MGRKPKKENCCKDCGIYIFKNDIDYYMVKNKLWDRFGCGSGNLCIVCFEKRVGRTLRAEDFINCKLNKLNPFIMNLKK